MNIYKQSISLFLLIILIFISCEDSDSPEVDKPILVTSITITSTTTSILKNTTTQLTVTVSPTNAADKNIEWSSNDETIATVDDNGLVTGQGVGTVDIMVKSSANTSITSSITLEVTGTTTNELTRLSILDVDAILIADNTFGLQLPLGTDITELQPSIEHNGGAIMPPIDEKQDFSEPITYTVTSDLGESQEWTVKVIAIQEPPSSEGFITTWITTNPGLSDARSIEIPTYPTEVFDYGYNYNVDWGDGNLEESISGNAKHTYEIPGRYHVSITGKFPRLFFNDQFYGTETDRQKIVLVNQWGNIQWQDFSRAFKGCTELDVIAMDTPDFTIVSRAEEMFSFCSKLVGNSSFSNWDVSNLVYASSMFASCDLFNQDIGNWDVSSMVRMSGFFQNTLTFNQDIGGWDLANAESIAGMFGGTKAFNQDIGDWNFPKVTSLSTMFQGAEAFNKDISNWDVSNIVDFSAMFNGAEKFNQPIGKWDMSNAIDLTAMFQSANSFTNDITIWDISSAENIAIMFAYNTTFNQDISVWNTSHVKNMGGLFWNNRVFNRDLSAWDTSNVNNMQKMFMGASLFDKSLGDWNVSNTTNMLEMFKGAGLSKENYDATLEGWNNLSNLQHGVEFDGGNSNYCLSEIARQNLIDTYSWIITDGGKDCN